MSAGPIPTEQPERYQPRFWYAIRRGAGDFYDRMGLTVLGSIAWSVPLLLILSLAAGVRSVAPPVVVVLIVLAGAWTWAGLAFGMNIVLAHRIAYFQDPGPDALTDGLHTFGVGALKLVLVQLLALVILGFDTAFFLSRHSAGLRVLGIVCAYALLLWLLCMTWQWPFLATENRATLKILKKSALVTADNPFFTLGVFLVTMTAGTLLLLSGIGAVAAFGGFVACLLTRAHKETLKKYGMAEDEPEMIEDEGWPSDGKPPRRLNPRSRPRNKWGE